MTRNSIPAFAVDYPERAQTLAQAFLPFYCINCYRKAETTYLTPDFGPFCDACLRDTEKLAIVQALTGVK